MIEAKNQESDLPTPAQKTISHKIFSGVRFFAFVSALIVLTSTLVLPDANPLSYLSAIPAPGLIAGAIVGFMILAVIIYFFAIPKGSAPGSTFDLESVSAIVIGLLAVVLLGMANLLAEDNSAILTLPVLLLVLIYTFYIYRIIRDSILAKRENEEIRQKYGQLVEIDREKSDFITVTSHQLRTPLTEIRWSIESVLRNSKDDSQTSILQKSLESVERLARIVNQMLGAHSFVEQNHDFQKTAVNAEALINEIIRELDLLAEQRGVSLSFSPPERQVLLDADKEQIKIALENIIDNAVRYSPRGAVKISVEGTRGKATIRVEDTGIGIANEDQSRIFTKFFRAKNAMLVQPDGSGIGLNAAKTIIEKHGGTISFFSQLEKGTIFIITFPLVK